MLENHMKQLSQDYQLDRALKSDAPGSYILPLEPHVSIHFSTEGEGYLLSSSFGEVPTNASKEEDFYCKAMLANLFGHGTKGSVLGLSEDGKHLMLLMNTEQELNYVDFRNVLEDFINSVDFWREEVLNYR